MRRPSPVPHCGASARRRAASRVRPSSSSRSSSRSSSCCSWGSSSSGSCSTRCWGSTSRARDAALAGAEAGNALGADCVILKAVEDAIGAPTAEDRITSVQIFKANPNGVQSAPRPSTPGAARGPARSSTASTVRPDVHAGRRTATPRRPLQRPGRLRSAERRRHDRRADHLHPHLGHAAPDFIGGGTGSDLRPLERHAHGAGPVTATVAGRAAAPGAAEPRRVRDGRARRSCCSCSGSSSSGSRSTRP